MIPLQSGLPRMRICLPHRSWLPPCPSSHLLPFMSPSMSPPFPFSFPSPCPFAINGIVECIIFGQAFHLASPTTTNDCAFQLFSPNNLNQHCTMFITSLEPTKTNKRPTKSIKLANAHYLDHVIRVVLSLVAKMCQKNAKVT